MLSDVEERCLRAQPSQSSWNGRGSSAGGELEGWRSYERVSKGLEDLMFALYEMTTGVGRYPGGNYISATIIQHS